ncbi:MAG: bifunctional oligoribonuclease/PAP phosphatase NrnA [Planctomycetes bacterium]|nr:bifunctional oligoribonuclease/PAP phosphatase NrnA [Planctomycetota bacterium]
MISLSKPPTTAAQREALELLQQGRRFLLTGHVRPDGDCIGAEAALASVLTALDKEVWILNPDPVEPQFDYLARDFVFGAYDGGEPPRHDVTVLLDCSELDRCGRLADVLAGGASRKLVIDHHLHHGPPWWDAAYVDHGASATGLLVHRIARQLGIELDRAGAQGVFTSIVTDTGWFKYSNTDAETLAVAADLVAHGVDPDALYRSIYQRKRRSHPLETGKVLATTEYYEDGRLAVVTMPREGDGGAPALDGDDVLDLLRAVESVEVVLSLRELAGGLVKLSARSKTDYDVNALARLFGGGGHRKASGATIEGELDEVKDRLVIAASRRFREARGS